MNRLSVTINDNHTEKLNQLQERDNIDSKSAAVRWLFDEYEELKKEYTESTQEYESQIERINSEHEAEIKQLEHEYESELEELRDRIDELERELEQERNKTRQILDERDEKKELVKYVKEERSVEQRWREASITTRLKWKVFGMDESEE